MSKRWPLNKADFWERYPFFRLLLPFMAGIALYPFVDNWINRNIGITCTALASCYILYGFIALSKQHSFGKTIAGFIALHAGLMLTTWILCYGHDIRTNSAWFGHHAGQSDYYVASVYSTPIEKEKTLRLEVDVVYAGKDEKLQAVRGSAVVYMYKYGAPVIREGDLIILPDDWQEIKNSGNPYEFDYAGYMANKNILLRQFVSGKEVAVYKYGDDDLPLIRTIHHWCVRQLEWYVTDHATLGLMKAMLMNDTDMLDEDLSAAYAATGIVHIIAISGGHIAVFFFVVALLLSWLRHRRYRWVKYVAAIPIIWLYVIVAGAPASAVRAATMFSILGVGFAMQKSPGGINQLLATAFILLCANPAWLFDIGFQLSFIAVLSIMLFYRPVYKWHLPSNKYARIVWSAVAVSIAAEILVAPLVIYYFHLFPLQFIVANVLAWLFMSIVLILGMLLVALSPFYSVAKFIALITVWLVTRFNELVYLLQQINLSSFSRLTLTNMQLLLVYTSITFFAVFFMRKYKRALHGGLIACCLFLALCCTEEWGRLHTNTFIVYNTGRDSYVEFVAGKTAYAINSPDSTSADIEKFVLQPAHVTLHVDGVAHRNANLIEMGNRRIFILNSSVIDTNITADYVVLNYSAHLNDISDIKEVFNAKVVVLGNAVKTNKIQLLKKEAERLGMQTHNVQEDGAFVLQGK